MERAQPNKILPAGFLKPNIIANHADNIRLLPHRFLKVAESGHELLQIILLEKSRKGNARTLVQWWKKGTRAVDGNQNKCTSSTGQSVSVEQDFAGVGGECQHLPNVFVLKLRIFPFEFSTVGVGGERLKHSPYRQAKIPYARLAIHAGEHSSLFDQTAPFQLPLFAINGCMHQ